ncbi:plant U-box 22 [Actinidia rufa]|uniref:U-box domain-containing protein n=1 Tax=Actinidia rufa TaxID=165716 RepID=A0A7J0GEJ0_9ERIC|nr:plant U-box 22 [Actinidia rufa]
MDDIEVPQYFICPISLQIMKDPVTAITGITYDRENIEHWVFQEENNLCPVTKQPMPQDSDLTPNHTLRRLIQSWCTEKALDRIPTPKPPLNKRFSRSSTKEIESVWLKLVWLRPCGYLFTSCHKRGETMGLEEALSIMCLVRGLSTETKLLLSENDQIIDSLMWVLGRDIGNHNTVKSHAMLVLKGIIGKASSNVLERLKPEFFERIVGALREGISHQGANSALQIMLDTCPWGRNRIMMTESGAVFELVELELGSPEQKTSELILGILFHLCSCADGRERFLSHSASVALITKRLLMVSPAADDRAMLIISLICKFSGTPFVIQEMLRVGTFAKLCVVLQGDCATYLKDKAKEILREHSNVWKNSPCIEVNALNLLSRTLNEMRVHMPFDFFTGTVRESVCTPQTDCFYFESDREGRASYRVLFETSRMSSRRISLSCHCIGKFPVDLVPSTAPISVPPYSGEALDFWGLSSSDLCLRFTEFTGRVLYPSSARMMSFTSFTILDLLCIPVAIECIKISDVQF